jgi:hypothetical protein
MSDDSKAPADLVENGDIVSDVFGYWPTFHDAEIVEFRLGIRKSESRYIVDLSVKILHCGQDNPDWKKPGPNCVIEFRCKDISGQKFVMNELSGGGWVDELLISKGADGRLCFDVRPLSGFDICVRCASVEVAGIYPSVSSRERTG